ncbi:alkaline phosphatase family protein [Herbiconiux sp. CPCC 203407]|uniref:Alkaline phosphatase family protein n=1 Tax=Herbiconiux oxytropis TaxID=2970915 RepID=A0AA42BT64_9MICO|nr:alkaline phosphatase family protein [Herbiconiux oxytropis]MCS5720477.1 alkaline phosphatase family protein [Herbiconiux oxytropis]MCS5726050.1 alkaline phosphatase family protein [Herbiconiux oxytropis]
MSTMLPTRQAAEPTLADVLPSCVAALEGGGGVLELPAADRVVVVLVDGLGSAALRARAGHARAMASGLFKRTTITSGFPTTTAAALSSLTTGGRPGQHGIVGYTALVPEADAVVNQLSGWSDVMRPATWQRLPTIFEQLAAEGVPSSTIGPAKYADSGLTHAILRGADYVAAGSIAERFDAARALFDQGGRRLVYLYVPELDQIAHARGWESDRWLATLEALDAEYARFSARLGRREGLLLTADHGIVDVPASSHVIFGDVPELVQGVRHVGGDPRCVQLYLEQGSAPDARTRLADAWHRREDSRAWIATREEAIQAGWFGEVDDAVLPRIGDVLVAARKLVAYYDGRDGDVTGRSMVGQHGSLTSEETLVPLLRAGAFAL